MTPRVVVAGTGSGVGKTTVACGLMAALRARGRRVQPFKVGPDYIDPGYHAMASGRPGRNLDAFLCGPGLIAPLVRHGEGGAHIAVIEGVMGLFDGASGRGALASTAQVAKLLGAPVLLVVDARGAGRSAAAVVHGFRAYDPGVHLAGVVLNRVGSDHHEAILREAIAPLGVPVVGALRRDARLRAPERHLGLVPAEERLRDAREAIDALAAAVAAGIDLDAVERIAAAAPPLEAEPWSPCAPAAAAPSRARIAIARGPAFGFHYTENLELLEAAGAELAPFDPRHDEALPAGCGALVLAGGFPEVYGEDLSGNAGLRDAVRAFARRGRPVLAECGGLLYLAERLDGRAMCGVVPVSAEMGDRLTLGYREARALCDSPCWRAGEVSPGHEFHYSRLAPDRRLEPPAWSLRARGTVRDEGYGGGAVHASYLHTHWAASPQVARRLVEAAAAWG